MNTEKKNLVVRFEGDKTTNGDYINALVKFFTEYGFCGDFVLEQAHERVKENLQKIRAFTEKIAGQ